MKILCLESVWGEVRNDMTVENLLKDLSSVEEIDYSIRYCGSKKQMKRAVSHLNPKDFDVLYFATHGLPGRLDLSDDTVPVEVLAEYMNGNCSGKVVYFGACSVLNKDDTALRGYVNKIHSRYMCGYLRSVDWTQTRAMDMLVLQAIAYYRRPSWLWKFLKRSYDDLLKQTSFYMYW